MSTSVRMEDPASGRSAVGALVRSSVDGDAAAWKLLVEGLSPLVWSVVHAHRLSDADGHEVYHTTWFRFAQHLGRLREPEKAGSWLASTARIECLNIIRSQSHPTRQENSQAAVSFTARQDVELPERSQQAYRPRRSRSAWSLTSWASRLAGRHRDTDQWRAHLAGAPEEGIVLTPRQQMGAAFGFFVAAVRYRLHDLLGGLWRPVDWLLQAPRRTNAFITAVVGVQALYIVGDDGLTALVTEVWEPCGIAGASLFALTRWLRRIRGIELATPDREPADD